MFLFTSCVTSENNCTVLHHYRDRDKYRMYICGIMRLWANIPLFLRLVA